jgi:carbon monoxide dehydrogenase subunit G
MRLDAAASVAAPQAEVFRRLSDFDRLASRIGSDAVTLAQQGNEWLAQVTFHGIERTGHLYLIGMAPPEAYRVRGLMDGVEAVMAVAVTAEGPRRSRIDVAIEARAASLKGRILVHTLRLMQHRLDERLTARLEAFAREIETEVAAGEA